MDQDNSREGQSSGPPSEALPDEYSEWMEVVMDEYLRSFPEMTEYQPDDMPILDMTGSQL